MNHPLPLRFHWTVSGSENVDAELCGHAESCRFESILTPVDFTRPDPLEQLMSMGRATSRIKFMAACRSALPAPEVYLQSIEHAYNVLPGRILLEIDCDRAPYGQMRGFLDTCRSRKRDLPELFISGDSSEAAELGIRYASAVWQSPCASFEVNGKSGPIMHFGVEVGFFAFLIARPTREQALDAVRELRAKFNDSGVSRACLFSEATQRASGLWAGANPVPDAPPLAMFGAFDEVSQTILRYRRCGITQFMFMGWPAREEMTYFSQGVLPLINVNLASSQTAM